LLAILYDSFHVLVGNSGKQLKTSVLPLTLDLALRVLRFTDIEHFWNFSFHFIFMFLYIYAYWLHWETKGSMELLFLSDQNNFFIFSC